jgi:hypothetical protein
MFLRLNQEPDLVNIEQIIYGLGINIDQLAEFVRIGLFRPVVKVHISTVWRRLPSMLTEALYSSLVSDIPDKVQISDDFVFCHYESYWNELISDYHDHAKTNLYAPNITDPGMCKGPLDFRYLNPKLAEPWRSDFYDFRGKMVYILPNSFDRAINSGHGRASPVLRVLPVEPYRRVKFEMSSALRLSLRDNLEKSANSLSIGNRFGTYSRKHQGRCPILCSFINIVKNDPDNFALPFSSSLGFAALKLSFFEEYFKRLASFEHFAVMFDYVDSKISEYMLSNGDIENILAVSDHSDQWIFAGVGTDTFNIDRESIFFYSADVGRFVQDYKTYEELLSRRDSKLDSLNRKYRYMVAVSVLSELSRVRFEMSNKTKDGPYHYIPEESRKMLVAALDYSLREALAKLNKIPYFRNLLSPNKLDIDNDVVRYYRKFEKWRQDLDKDFLNDSPVSDRKK